MFKPKWDCKSLATTLSLPDFTKYTYTIAYKYNNECSHKIFGDIFITHIQMIV